MAMDPYAAYQYWGAYQYGAYPAYAGYSQGYYGQQAYDGSQGAQATSEAAQAPAQSVAPAVNPTHSQSNHSAVAEAKTSTTTKRASRPYLFADAKKLKVKKINKAYARARTERCLQAITALSKLNKWLPKKYLAS